MLSQETLDAYRRMTPGERLAIAFGMMRENTPYLLAGRAVSLLTVTAALLHSPAPERNSCRTGTVTLCPPSATNVTAPGAYSAATTLPKPSGTRDTPWM